MDTKEIESLFEKAQEMKKKYEKHFGIEFPERILGWWNPVNISLYPEELANGVAAMEKDVDAAIASNKPIEEIPEEEWKNIIF